MRAIVGAHSAPRVSPTRSRRLGGGVDMTDHHAGAAPGRGLRPSPTSALSIALVARAGRGDAGHVRRAGLVVSLIAPARAVTLAAIALAACGGGAGGDDTGADARGGSCGAAPAEESGDGTYY